MKFIIAFALHLTLYKVCYTSNLHKLNCLNEIVNNVISEVNPYQVAMVLFNFNTNKNKHEDKEISSVIKNVITRKITILIEMEKDFDYENYVYPRFKCFTTPKYTTLFISMLLETATQNLIHEFKNILDFIINLSPRTVRPRCLFLINNIDLEISSEVIQDILKYSWMNKFLDVTIVQYLSKTDICLSNLIVYIYNPFSKDYTIACYYPEMIIFPNKLRNMHQYPLKIALTQRPPAINFERDSNGTPINVNGSDYGVMKIFSIIMNFSIVWVAPEVLSYGEAVSPNTSDSLLDLIVKNEIDCAGNQLFFSFASKEAQPYKSEISSVNWVDEFVALVPVYPAKLWPLRHNALYMLLLILAQVSFMAALAKLFRFDLRFWEPHYILQMLMGNVLPKLPLRLIERLVFFFLFILSQQYSVNLYAKLAGMQLNDLGQGPFETLDDLEKHDIILETHPNYLNITFYEAKGVLLRLKKNIKPVADLMHCPRRVLEKKNVACLIDHSIAEMNIHLNSRLGPPKMKILKHRFWSGPKGHILSEASPYVSEFNRLLQIMKESSIWSWYQVYDKNIINHRNSPMDMSDSLLRSKLMIVWFLGCGISFIAFLSEFIAKYFE